MEHVYLDYAASTPVRPEVREAMLPLLTEGFGNPSSLHRWGRDARVQLESARARLARTLGASPSEIVFTRGGTEADNLAVLGRARLDRAAPVVCSAIEHKAVLAAARAAQQEGSDLHVLPVDASGVARIDALPDLLARSPSVVSVMWVNNEVGAVQPVEEMARLCADAGVIFHTDAIQAFGKLPVQVDRSPIGLLSLSAHKFYGPKGTGALFVRKGVKLRPLVFGGGHERGIRSGTEDVAGAVGLAVAAELAVRELEEQSSRLRALRDRLEAGLRARVPDLTVNAEAADRAPHILNVSVEGASNEALLVTLDLEGLGVSSGSACSSGAVTPSHVLTAMGVPSEIAGPSIRFSLGRGSSDGDVERVLEVFPRVVAKVRSFTRA